jgi:Peptidase family M41
MSRRVKVSGESTGPRLSPSQLRERQGTAYHEAGHAVVALWLPLVPKMQRVTVVPNDAEGTLGCVRHWHMPSFNPELDATPRTRQRCAEMIIALLAGEIAERRAMGRVSGHQSDHEKARDLADWACDGSQDQIPHFLRWLRIRAEELVATRWPAIEALAKTLLRENTIIGHWRIRELVLTAGRSEREQQAVRSLLTSARASRARRPRGAASEGLR